MKIEYTVFKTHLVDVMEEMNTSIQESAMIVEATRRAYERSKPKKDGYGERQGNWTILCPQHGSTPLVSYSRGLVCEKCYLSDPKWQES